MHARTDTKTKTTLRAEEIDPLWEDLKKGLEDVKAGRVRVWKPRALRTQH